MEEEEIERRKREAELRSIYMQSVMRKQQAEEQQCSHGVIGDNPFMGIGRI